MWLNTRFEPALALCVGAVWLLAACQAPAPLVPVTLVDTAATATASPTAQPVASPAASVTQVGAVPLTITPAVVTVTATPLPSATTLAVATSTSSPTLAPTGTTPAATQPVPSPTVAPTRVLVTAAPASPPSGPPASPAAPGLYGTTGGPPGFSSNIRCERAGGPCAPLMPPGDVSFRLVLASAATAPWTHFVNYGLSVEKDGANVAALFMFVDAGWLQPGAVVGFGTSRNFSQPGTYVIRSSGCLTTDRNSNNCQWATIAGDVVTFVIQ